jgi:hypothetical protein
LVYQCDNSWKHVQTALDCTKAMQSSSDTKVGVTISI